MAEVAGIRVKKLTKLFSEEMIAERVSAIAEQINKDYENEPLVLICVLKGAFMFFSDLVKQITVQPEVDFVRLSSYGTASASTGAISFSKDTELPLAGKHIIVVEDVVDSGYTMSFLAGQLVGRGAKSLRIAALVDKVERRKVDVHVDYAGFSLSSGFIVGYGLDYAEHFRELPAVCVLELDE